MKIYNSTWLEIALYSKGKTLANFNSKLIRFRIYKLNLSSLGLFKGFLLLSKLVYFKNPKALQDLLSKLYSVGFSIVSCLGKLLGEPIFLDL